VCHFQFFINSQQRTDNELDVDEDFAEGGSDEDTDGLEPNSEEDAEEDED
jgi:general transcription factor 3C polypeptide 3 (transcription factor C subunit 4)